MAGLDDLKSLSLEKVNTEAFVERGEWKRYTKASGAFYYFHTPTGQFQWQAPKEWDKAVELEGEATAGVFMPDEDEE